LFPQVIIVIALVQVDFHREDAISGFDHLTVFVVNHSSVDQHARFLKLLEVLFRFLKTPSEDVGTQDDERDPRSFALQEAKHRQGLIKVGFHYPLCVQNV
jgi:hypothetical protein